MSSSPCSYPQAGPLVSNQKQQRAEAAIDPISIFYRLSDGYLLRFPGMADFSMDANGSRITATPVPDLDDATLDHLFLNQVAPLAMSRQHKLVLHGGAVVVGGLAQIHEMQARIDPVTGNILAMVSKPGFDANLLSTHDPVEANENYKNLLARKSDPLINRAIGGDLYVPGSVFKLVVSAAALESGNFTPESKIDNPSKFKLPGTETYVYNSGEGTCGGRATVSLADALRFSCNVPFAQVGIQLGQDQIRRQAELFGFGKSISVPLKVTPSVYPRGLDDAQTALTAFGQFDVRVTPMQMVMVSAAIANQGRLMKPNLIENVLSSNLASLYAPTPSEYSRPVSEKTAGLLTQMMIDAVAKGVSSNAQISGVKVAGKTGTAQNGKDEPYTLWFTGFAPADKPRVAVAVVIEDGGGMGQNGRGNSLAAPVARKVMQAVLNK